MEIGQHQSHLYKISSNLELSSEFKYFGHKALEVCKGRQMI